MDVRCSRCRTEYDFDDLLISERGTTVKCTNCGHQFKIFPAGGAAPERWLVKTHAGQELVYTSLKELQRAIAKAQVSPSDMVSRGRNPPRPLSQIAELEPFFVGQTPSQKRVDRTLLGVSAAPESARVVETFPEPAKPAPRDTEPAPVFTAESRPLIGDSGQGSRNAPTRADRLPPPIPVAKAEPPSISTKPPPVAHEPPPVPRPSGRDGPAVEERIPPSEPLPPVAPAPSPPAPLSQGEPRSQRYGAGGPRSTPRASSQLTPSPASVRGSAHRSYDQRPFESPEPIPRAHSRWIAGVVIVGVATLLAITVGRRYLLKTTLPPEEPAAKVSDQRVTDLLGQASRLIDDADYEAAREQLLKASALGEKDPAVLVALARVETLRADVAWLKHRLADPAVSELFDSTQRELQQRVSKARQAVDAAFAVAPEDPSTLRARVDVLRISGEPKKAREWTQPLSSDSSDPRNAYVLAALDLAEEDPAWPSVIQRMRLASSRERAPGRARAALIYALSRSGQRSEAEAELSRVRANPAGGLLTEELQHFVERQPEEAEEEKRGAGAHAEAFEPGAAPKDEAGDPKTLLKHAAEALSGGEIARAENLFHLVLEKHPENSEALAGLAQIARFRGDTKESARYYDEVLEKNPSNLLALAARADLKWESGDRAGALPMYREVAARAAPGSDISQRAKERLAQGAKAPKPEPPAAAAPPAPEPAPTPPPEIEPTRPETPNIDTTDLPGFP